MGVKKSVFSSVISGKKKIALDSSILIYHLEDINPFSSLTQHLFAEIGFSNLICVVPVLCITELLAKPYQVEDLQKVKACEEFIFSIPTGVLASIDFEVAKEAARIRGVYNLHTPDALFVATALKNNCDAFITNDLALKRVSSKEIEIIILDEFL